MDTNIHIATIFIPFLKKKLIIKVTYEKKIYF